MIDDRVPVEVVARPSDPDGWVALHARCIFCRHVLTEDYDSEEAHLSVERVLRLAGEHRPHCAYLNQDH